MPRMRSILTAATIVAASSTNAQVTDPLISISASSSLGSGSVSFSSADFGAIVQPDTGILFILFNAPLVIQDPNNNNIIGRITQLNVLNRADSTDTPGISDALTSIGFAAFAGDADTTFNLTASFINTGAVADAALRASAGITVTDNTGDTATLTGLGAGGTFFNASYNNGTTFADLVAGPLAVGATSTFSTSESFPAVPPGAFNPIGAPLNNIQAQFNFRITAGDSASGTSVFVSIPAPASATLLAATGLVGVRRRR